MSTRRSHDANRIPGTHRWHATTMASLDDFDALLGAPATPAQRRRQQASQARFDRAVGLVEQAAKAASTGDQAALAALVARMDQVAFDDFEQHHPPSAALNFLLYDVVCDPGLAEAGVVIVGDQVDHV